MRNPRPIMTYHLNNLFIICLATQRIIVYIVYFGTPHKFYKLTSILSRPGLSHFLQLNVHGVMNFFNLSLNPEALRALFPVQRHLLSRWSHGTSAKELFFSIGRNNTSVKVEICLRCNMTDFDKRRFD